MLAINGKQSATTAVKLAFMLAGNHLTEIGKPGQPSLSCHDLSSANTAESSVFSILVEKLRCLISEEMPVGYEDETGFHYGVEGR